MSIRDQTRWPTQACTLASAAAGYTIESSRIVRELVREQAGTPQSTVWFDAGAKLPAVNSARSATAAWAPTEKRPFAAAPEIHVVCW